jgi:CheY-like chemotaxis protein
MGKRILVADDSRTIQQAFAMVLDGTGYTLSFAKSVDEALAAAKRDGRPDLVLSDVVLGTGSGYDLCAQLKADAGLGDVPVYILASAQNPYDDARGRKVGADGHLAKPFESQALLDAVASALAMPTRRPSAAMPAQALDFGAATSRYAEEEVGGADEDSYGEITIERGPTGAPSPTSWTTRPPSRAGVDRSVPVAPTLAPPAAPAPRPPMIPGPRPSLGMPAQRPSTTPQPSAGLPPPPAPPAPRQPARTMMGFPSTRPGTTGRTTGFPATAAPPVAAPVLPSPSRPATVPPATAVPGRPTGFPTPAAPAAPVVARPTTHAPSLPVPAPAPRPAVPRMTPSAPAAAIPSAAQAQPITRRTATPPPTAAAAQPAPAVAAGVAAVTEKIDQKMAAIAARGPEYEAIAKLSREIIEQVVWEVVPELAETIVRQAVDRLASAKK